VKIVHVIHWLANGGGEKFAVELASEQSKTNIVSLCTFKSIEANMVPPKRLNDLVQLITFKINKNYTLKILFKLVKLLKREKPDVLHVHLANSLFYVLICSIFFRKIKYIHTLHHEFSIWNRYYKYINRIRFLLPDFYHVCISEKIYHDFVKVYPRLKFEWINNGIYKVERSDKYSEVIDEINVLKRTSATIVFITIGNYSDYKNYQMLAKVFNKLEDEKYDVILLILGDDKHPNFSKVSKIRCRNTHQLGFKENVADYLIASDLFISSSTKEGMPLVILEAFSAGKSVVATPAGGIVDMVKSGTNGVLAKGFDEKCLYDAILEYINYDSEKKENIRKGNRKKYITQYSMELCTRKYLKLYEEKDD